MGGCSSKPQTAECNDGLLFHTGLKASDSSPHQTLESLFNQHGRDGEALLEDAQTLHELLLHAVELPDFENQTAQNTEANLQTRTLQPDLSFPCKLNSPVSVISHAAERDASKCMEGSLPANLAESNEETGAKMQVTEKNAEKCTQAEVGLKPNLAEGNEEKGGASNLEASQSGLAEVTEEKCSNLELMLLALPEDNAANCIKVEGFMSNVAEENEANAEKLEDFVSNLSEVKRDEECPKLTVALSNSAEEGAIKLESPESLNLEPKSDFLKTPESTSPECAEYETRGHNLGPKSDELKISEPTYVFQRIKASDAMESKEADVQGLNELSMTGEIEREVQDEIAMETVKTPKQGEKAMQRVKNQNALQGAETDDQLEKAIDQVLETENAEKALEIEKDKISHRGEKAEVQNDKAELQNQKAMEGELPKAQFESGGMSWVQGEKAMEDNTLQPKTEKAMECDLQDEKSIGEDEKTGVQNERILNGDVERIQRAEDDEKTVCMEKLGNVHDAEEKESQEEKKTGVHGDETRVQTKKEGLEDEERGVQHEERTEDEKAMANVSLLHVKAEDEEAKDSCFEPLTGSEQSIAAIHDGPTSLEHASTENTAEAAELGLIEKLNESDQKFACKDNTADIVTNFGLTEKLEADLKKLVCAESTIEAVGLEDIEKREFEQKKTQRIESSNEAVAAVAGGEVAKLCDNFKALQDGQSQPTDSEQMRHIERYEKLEHDILGAPQHCEADKLDDKKNAKATVLEESSIEAAIWNSEEKKAPEALEERQSMHEGNGREESSNMECPSKLVVENDTNSDEKVKMEVSDEEDGFVQKGHDAEKLQIQIPMQELDLIISKGEESHTQAHGESVLSSFPESSVQGNLSSPTVVEIDVEKHVVDISSSSLSVAESKPRIKTSGEVIDDANEMEDSIQCGEKGEGLKASEVLENLEICN